MNGSRVRVGVALLAWLGVQGVLFGLAYGWVAVYPRVRLIGLPLMEIYRTTRVNPGLEVNHTDVYVSVQRL